MSIPVHVALRRAVLRRVLPPLLCTALPLIRRIMSRGSGSPLKAWIWKHLLDAYVQEPNLRIARSNDGAMFVGTTRDYIFRNIAVFGAWEPNASAWLRSWLRPGDVMIDVGANIGYFTLLAARCVGREGRVIALEPLAPALRALRRNVAVNDADNVRIVPVGADDERASRSIAFSAPDDTGGASTEWSQWRPFRDRIEVAPLHELLDADEVARVRLIKIDIEGAEVRALRGLMPLFPQLPADAAFVIEVSADTYPPIAGMLQPLGYRAFELLNPSTPSHPLARPTVTPQPLAPNAQLPAEHVSYVMFLRPERDVTSRCSPERL